MIKMLFAILVVVLSMPVTTILAKPWVVDYAPSNIDWDAKEIAVSRSRQHGAGPMGMTAGSSGQTIETRVMRSASMRYFRITETIETLASSTTGQTTEVRRFLSGERLDEVMMIFSTHAAVEDFEQRYCQLGGRARIIRRYGRGLIVRVRLSLKDWQGNEAWLAHFKAGVDDSVKAAYLSPMTFSLPQIEAPQPSPNPNDPLAKQQWHLDQIGVRTVWERGLFGFTQTACAVFDTGIRVDHEDLQANITQRVSALRDDPSPADHHGHGSHCSGIIGADPNNDLGICGVAQVANLTSIRGPISYMGDADIIDGYQWAYDNQIKVLSCSFGRNPTFAGYDPAEHALINEMGADNGTILVVAAGNDGNDNDILPTYPASYDSDNIVTVVATDPNDLPASHGWQTSYGATSTDIAAPGTNIISCTSDAPNAYASWDGTSMATPIVAATVSMIYEQNPTWTYRDVIRRLYQTAHPVPELKSICTTGARVDCAKALSKDAHFLSVQALTRVTYESGDTLTLTVTASHDQPLKFTLMNQDPAFAPILLKTLSSITPNQSTPIAVPLPKDLIGRQYFIKVHTADTTNSPHSTFDIPARTAGSFAYTQRFKVKAPGVVEWIRVSNPTADQKVDAAHVPFTFRVSHAPTVIVSLMRRQATGGEVTFEKRVGRLSISPDTEIRKEITLVGNGWETPEGEVYFIRIYDEDDRTIYGDSATFDIDRSSCAIVVSTASADAPELDNPPSYVAGEPIRVKHFLPMSDLYYFFLAKEDLSESYEIKQIWLDGDIDGSTDIANRTFTITLPESFVGSKWFIHAFDIFDTAFMAQSPAFEVTAPTKPLPTLLHAIDTPNLTIKDTYAWRPVEDPSATGGWAAQAGEVSALERSLLDTEIETPATIRFRWRGNGLTEQARGAFYVVKQPHGTQPSAFGEPLTTLTQTTDDWETVTHAIEKSGRYTLRWVLDKAAHANDTEGALWLDDVQIAHLVAPATLSHQGGIFQGQTPEISMSCTTPEATIYYTLDGSEPTPATSLEYTRPIRLTQSATLRARAFRDGWSASQSVTASYWVQRGTGSVDSPYTLSTPTDLYVLAQLVNRGNAFTGKTIHVDRDLDFANSPAQPTIGLDTTQSLPDGKMRPFSGTLDGGHHTWYNLRLRHALPTELPAKDHAFLANNTMLGLFATLTASAHVKDLTLVNPTLDGGEANRTIGAFAGSSFGHLHNLHVQGGTIHGNGTLGGLVGALYGTLEQSSVSDLKLANKSSTSSAFRPYTLGALVGRADATLSDPASHSTFNILHSSERSELVPSVTHCASHTTTLSGENASTGQLTLGGAIGTLIGNVPLTDLDIRTIIRSSGDGVAAGGIIGTFEPGPDAKTFSLTRALIAPTFTNADGQGCGLVYGTAIGTLSLAQAQSVYLLEQTATTTNAADLQMQTLAALKAPQVLTDLQAGQAGWGSHPTEGLPTLTLTSPKTMPLGQPQLSHSPGFFIDPFELTITPPTDTPDAQVLYTIQGEDKMLPYTQPIPLTTDRAYTLTLIAKQGESQSVPLIVTYTPFARPQCSRPIVDGVWGDATYFPGSMMIVLTSPTKGATLHYTLDGSTPTGASPIYTAPIPLREDATLCAIAIKRNFIDSPIITKTLTRETWPVTIRLLALDHQTDHPKHAGDLLTLTAPTFSRQRFRRWSGTASHLLPHIFSPTVTFDVKGDRNQILELRANYDLYQPGLRLYLR